MTLQSKLVQRRFISAEPLLGPLDLERWFKHVQVPACQRCTPDKPFRVIDAYSGHLWGRCDCACHPGPRPVRPDWVIVGGESGPGARPMNPAWARDIVEFGRFAGFDVFVKQLGTAWAKQHGGPSKGQDMEYWPEQLQVRQMPKTSAATALLSTGRGRDDMLQGGDRACGAGSNVIVPGASAEAVKAR